MRGPEHRESISSALMAWLEHASTHGAQSRSMVFAAGDYTTHAARNLRWMCECLMPMYGGSVNPQRTVWTLPNGAVLSLAYIEQDDLSDYEGQSLSMVIVLNAHQWQPEVIEILTGYLRPTAGVPTRYVTTGEIQR